MPVKIKGLNKAIRRMRKRAQEFSAKDPKLYRKVGEIASKSVSKNFESQGRPKWKRRKGDYEWPILWKTGKMRAHAEKTALFWKHRKGLHVNKIWAPFYGKFHQYGTVHLPVRKFARIMPKEIDRMKKVFRKAFLRN